MADQTVVLTPGTGPNGAFQWQMSLNGGNAAGPPYPPIHVSHGNTATIDFSIQNAPGVTFTDHPFLVPTDAEGVKVDKQTPTTLTVSDHNLKKGDVPYVIMFNGPAAKLDPIIQNDGGGRIAPSLSTYDTTTVAIGAFVVGVIITLIVRAMFRKRNV